MKLGVVIHRPDFISLHNSIKAHKVRKIRRFDNPPVYIIPHISMKFNAKIVYELCSN